MKDTQKLVIFNLILIFCLTAFMKVKAASDTTALSLAITSGSLSVAAPTEAAFAGKSFSFNGQDSTGNTIGNVQTTDARGNRAGWNINVTATNWQDSGDAGKVIQYNGDGTTQGRLSLDVPVLDNVTPVAGDGLAGLTMGDDASFADNSILKLISAPAGSGSGQYDISGLSATQFIPGNQPTGNYVTNLTLTIS